MDAATLGRDHDISKVITRLVTFPGRALLHNSFLWQAGDPRLFTLYGIYKMPNCKKSIYGIWVSEKSYFGHGLDDSSSRARDKGKLIFSVVVIELKASTLYQKWKWQYLVHAML